MYDLSVYNQILLLTLWTFVIFIKRIRKENAALEVNCKEGSMERVTGVGKNRSKEFRKLLSSAVADFQHRGSLY